MTRPGLLRLKMALFILHLVNAMHPRDLGSSFSTSATQRELAELSSLGKGSGIQQLDAGETSNPVVKTEQSKLWDAAAKGHDYLQFWQQARFKPAPPSRARIMPPSRAQIINKTALKETINRLDEEQLSKFLYIICRGKDVLQSAAPRMSTQPQDPKSLKFAKKTFLVRMSSLFDAMDILHGLLASDKDAAESLGIEKNTGSLLLEWFKGVLTLTQPTVPSTSAEPSERELSTISAQDYLLHILAEERAFSKQVATCTAIILSAYFHKDRLKLDLNAPPADVQYSMKKIFAALRDIPEPDREFPMINLPGHFPQYPHTYRSG